MNQQQRLYQILQLAATAPGNWERFQASGLIASRSRDGTVHFVENWQERFLHLQPITKVHIRCHPGKFLASVDDIVYRGTTSGTGGRHFVYFADQGWNQARVQSRERSLSWWGIDEFTPIVNVASRLFPVRECDLAIAGPPSLALIDRLLTQLAVTPAAIRGYPSRLCEIATLLGDREIPLIVAVICTGESLFEFQKTLLEKVFAAPVVNEYGCQESGISGLSCPEAGRLHLDGDRCLYEMVDGQLVTTDLWNQVMPMVRYQCGDVLEFYTDDCPCGRPGITAKWLGRVGQQVQGHQGITPVSNIPMPALPGILTYQAIRTPTQIVVNAVPVSQDIPVNLQPLQDWAETTFGPMTTQVTIAKPDLHPSESPNDCDPFQWIQNITQESWSTWLQSPQFPRGTLEPTASLLYQLSHPHIISYERLPLSTWTCLQQILQQPPDPDPAIAKITARTILFACCFIASDPSVDQVYENASQRLQLVAESTPISSPDNTSATSLDLLIPTLFLETSEALHIWQTWLQMMADSLPAHQPHWAIDTFTIQHLLHAFEPAVRRAYRYTHPLLQTLRPLLSVLIGDLTFFAPQLGPWLLAHWFHLLHQQPLPNSPWLRPADPFAAAWLTWRQQLLTNPHTALLLPLEEKARSPEQQERVSLELGYHLLATGQVPDPEEWIVMLHQMRDNFRGLTENEVDPVPWHPILKALVKPLFDRGYYNLAYDCLLAVTPLSSRFSAFERMAAEHNYKQFMIMDNSGFEV